MSGVNIFLAILVFSIIIVIHEFGHFIVAKANKVTVLEFSLGMGPRLISWGKTSNGCKVVFFKSSKYFEEHTEFNENTLYSVKLLPFGGSCMMLGEEEEVEDESAFGKKSVYARMAIIFAGPLFNFILAFVLSVIVISWVGYESATIIKVEDGSPMAAAGVQAGDVIKEINGDKIVIDGDLDNYTMFTPFTGDAVDIVIEREGKEQAFSVTPQEVKGEDGSSSYKLGFYHGKRDKVGVLGTIKYASYEVVYWIETTVKSLGHMIRGKVSADDISGPVGIVKTVGDVVDVSSKEGPSTVVINLMIISILLTANLGVMNLLPIPALDGGRLLFLIIEWIRRKPLPAKFENYVNVGGFMLLMMLMVFIMVNDVIKLF